jgi:hypothetical protein
MESLGRWNIKVQFKSTVFMGRTLWRTMEAGILEAVKNKKGPFSNSGRALTLIKNKSANYFLGFIFIYVHQLIQFEIPPMVSTWPSNLSVR